MKNLIIAFVLFAMVAVPVASAQTVDPREELLAQLIQMVAELQKQLADLKEREEKREEKDRERDRKDREEEREERAEKCLELTKKVQKYYTRRPSESDSQWERRLAYFASNPEFGSIESVMGERERNCEED